MKTRITIALLVALVSVGCAVGDETTADAESDLAGFKGRSFKDGGLQIKLEFKDGIQASTQNKRFIRATVSRGASNFGAWCTLQGASATTSVSCRLGATTVSNDDDESLSFEVERSGNAANPKYELSFDYRGDETFLGKEFGVLAGSSSSHNATGVSLTPSKKATLPEHDPFALADAARAGLDDLAGVKVLDADLGASVAVKAYAFSLSDKMDMSVTAFIDTRNSRSVSAKKAISLLKTPGSLASGLASRAEIATRTKAAFR
jgi:hypothetical protein